MNKAKQFLLKQIERANADGMTWRGYFDASTWTTEGGQDVDTRAAARWDYLEISGAVSAWIYIPDNVRTLGELREYLTQGSVEAEKVAELVRDYKAPYESAWDRGLKEYALDLLDGLEILPRGFRDLQKYLLNGADNWSAYSWGGSSLIYDYNIAERLCTPSELRRTDNGFKRPNSREEWLDVQARALGQASRMIKFIINREAQQ